MYNYVPTIVMPTRITNRSATLIDHIYYLPEPKHNSSSSIHSGDIWCDITDHLPNYCLLLDSNVKQQNKEEPPLVRLFLRRNIKKIKHKVSNIDWSEIYDSSNVDTAIENFQQKIKCFFESSFKLVKLSRKQTRNKKNE